MKIKFKKVSEGLPELKRTTTGKTGTIEASVECLVHDGESVFVDSFSLDEGFHPSVEAWVALRDIVPEGYGRMYDPETEKYFFAPWEDNSLGCLKSKTMDEVMRHKPVYPKSNHNKHEESDGKLVGVENIIQEMSSELREEIEAKYEEAVDYKSRQGAPLPPVFASRRTARPTVFSQGDTIYRKSDGEEFEFHAYLPHNDMNDDNCIVKCSTEWKLKNSRDFSSTPPEKERPFEKGEVLYFWDDNTNRIFVGVLDYIDESEVSGPFVFRKKDNGVHIGFKNASRTCPIKPEN